MNTQAFIHTERPTPDGLEPAQNPGGDVGGILIKPLGGLWTSTLAIDGNYLCDWHRWCHGEHWGLTDDSHVWALEPSDDVNLLVIDGEDDLMAMLDEYDRESEPYSLIHSASPDFEAIADDYDGIHLTERGQQKTRFTHPGLNGWDAESTVWFDWHFTDVQYVEHLGEDYSERDW